MKKRLIYMLVALVAAISINYLPLVSFVADKGILYNRDYIVDQHSFQVLLTDLQTGMTTLDAIRSVEGLWVCYTALWICCLLVLLCFFSRSWRLRLATLAICLSSAYYVFLIYYVIRIEEAYFPTLYPNISILCPAVIIQMMILVRSSILNDLADQDESGNDLY